MTKFVIELVWIGVIRHSIPSGAHFTEDPSPGDAVVVQRSEDHHQRQKTITEHQRGQYYMGRFILVDLSFTKC